MKLDRLKQALTIPIFIICNLLATLGLVVNLDKDVKFVYSFDIGIGFFIFLFILITYFFYKTGYIKQRVEKRGRVIAIILAVIFSLLQIIGYTYNAYNESIFEANYIFKLIICFLAYLILSYRVILIAFYALKYKLFKNPKNSVKKKQINRPYWLIVLFLFVCWLPFYLYYHPGIVCYDGEWQLAFIREILPLSNHHPVIHTLFISVFVKLADFFGGDNNLAIALYCFFQMIASSMVFAYIIEFMRKHNINKAIRIATLLLFAFMPTYSMFSITLWKDAGFGMAFSFVIIHLIKMVAEEDYFNKKGNFILFVLALIFASLLRHNGIYIMAICFPFVIYAFKKHYKFILSSFAICFAFCFGWNLYITNVLHAEPVEQREKYSVIAQAFARVSILNEKELDNQDKETIYKFIPTDDLKSLYTPNVADPVKYQMDDEEIKNNKSQMIALYFKLLFKYPKTVIDSFVDGAYGYFYPDFSYWRVSNGIDNEIRDYSVGSLYEMLGLKESHLFKTEFIGEIGKLVNDADKFAPYNMLCSIGFWFEVILFLIGYNIYVRNNKMLITFLPIVLLWLLCLVGPINGEYRYLYAMFITMPVYLAFTLKKNKVE